MKDLKRLAELIRTSSHMTALTGAGISTLSGIADFRGEKNPIWDKFPQDKVFNAGYFREQPQLFFDFLREILAKEYEPNSAHKLLRNLEEKGMLKAVITQNIDGLHSRAGSKKVYELHGSIYRNYCSACRKEYGYEEFVKKVYREKVPSCSCSGVIRPSVVFFGEQLPDEDFKAAVFHASRSDLMLVAGTSLAVQPAGYMPFYTMNNGGKIVMINRGTTVVDERAVLKFDDIKDAFEGLSKELGI